MDKCIFCAPYRYETFKEILLENEHAIVVRDNFPVSPGHLLVIAKQHFEDWFVAPLLVQHSTTDLMQQASKLLANIHKPDGFNIGSNCGSAAGQSVFHMHFHLIPRYYGDHGKPEGGVRHAVESGIAR